KKKKKKKEKSNVRQITLSPFSSLTTLNGLFFPCSLTTYPVFPLASNGPCFFLFPLKRFQNARHPDNPAVFASWRFLTPRPESSSFSASPPLCITLPC
ncbi:MAG: hypothetical protein LBE69_24185, partial [Klebsiella sp.]|uniref:hypothetical protein n=1 Tax=Klebsiella sp. TaxID=576 RepID=UPI00258A5F65